MCCVWCSAYVCIVLIVTISACMLLYLCTYVTICTYVFSVCVWSDVYVCGVCDAVCVCVCVPVLENYCIMYTQQWQCLV